MNLETISSPGGETGAVCSLSSLLALGCRSKAEAAHSFAKKLHTKLWSLSPSAPDGLSANQAGQCRAPSSESGNEENASTWGVAVEARFDVNSKRVQSVVTSVPLITQNHNKILPTVVYQPSACLSRQGSLDSQSSPIELNQFVTNMEHHKNATHHNHQLEKNSWMTGHTSYLAKNHNGGLVDGQSVSLVRGHDQESDTSSTTTTNPMSDSDQYFDFGIETPFDLDSAGEETVSRDNAIVINHDDGLPVQPEGMESGCIFGSPTLSGEDSDDLDDREEEPSFYESLSQSPASVGFLQKANHDRFNFGQSCTHVCEPVPDLAVETSTSVVNTNQLTGDHQSGLEENGLVDHNIGQQSQDGDTLLMPLASPDSNGKPDDNAPAQSTPVHTTPRVELARGDLRSAQGDLEDETNWLASDESATGPLRSEITQFSSAESNGSSISAAVNENQLDSTVSNQQADCQDVNQVSDVLSHLSISTDMVRLDPVVVDQLFNGSAPVNEAHQSNRASNLQLELVKHLEDRYIVEDNVVPIVPEVISLNEPPISDDNVDSSANTDADTANDASAEPELDEESSSQSTSSSEVSSTKESSPALQDGETDEEEDQPNRHRVQRSTSLKTGKTPPGTPGRKKIVRFADALGLDLALVRTFLDEVPNVPQSAFSDLSDVPIEDETSLVRTSTTPQSGSYIRITRRDPNTNSTVTTFVNSPRILVASFAQPGNLPDFLERVKRQKISLETACMMDETRLRGVVRVLNVDFHKSVLIRFTVDEWRTQGDVLATYVTDSCDGLSDRFSFTLAGTHSMQPGQRLIFALCYRVAGQEIWDNNQGKNYVFQCISNSNYLPSIALNPPSVSDTFLPYL